MKLPENGPVGVVVTVKDNPGKLLVASGTRYILVTWNGEYNTNDPEIEILTHVDNGEEGYRWNDGKVDSIGRLWAGN